MHDLITFILVAIAVDAICSGIAQRTANEIQRRQPPAPPAPPLSPEKIAEIAAYKAPPSHSKITDVFKLPEGMPPEYYLAPGDPRRRK